MKRFIIIAAAALLAAVPATLGLVGNASFAQNVPVRVPSQANLVNDKGGLRTPSPSSTTEDNDDNGGQSGSTSGDDSNSGKDDNVGDSSGKDGSDDGSGHS